MCCENGEHDSVPGVVATMLAGYHELHDLIGYDWGSEGMDVFAHAQFAPFGALLAEVGRQARAGETPSLAAALLRLAGDRPPHGLLVVRTAPGGDDIAGDRLGCVIPGSAQRGAVLIASSWATEVEVEVAGTSRVLAPGATRLVPLTASWDMPRIAVRTPNRLTEIDLVERRESARLTVRAPLACRWGVVDDLGGSWFPTGTIEKWDVHGRPWFHGAEVSLNVPAGTLAVSAARAVEYRSRTATISVTSATASTVDLAPSRRFDPAAAGWFGGDLHVHLNYSGDHVADPDFAASAQAGEGLHLMNLVAGNLFTSLVYDREAFEHHAGDDLPWSSAELVARWGVEYRNDLLGHLHALNPSAPPSRYHTGHERSDTPDDWPPNAVACRELRALGATVGYTHPVSAPLHDSPAPVFSAMPRSTEARELVADAALGLVDSMDLLGPQTLAAGTVALYHRLLNAGIRLAATAGTDTMLSLARCHTFSNPPGWARAYADLRGAPLTVDAWQDAVRNGRTLVTNGPWLTLEVDGHRLGSTLDVHRGATVRIIASCTGDEAATLSIIGPDGPVHSLEVDGANVTTSIETVIDGPGWFAAEAVGPPHPDVLGAEVYAHTSPIYVDVAGRRVARREDAAWCLDWLDRLEVLAGAHGHFSHAGQLDDLREVIDAARDYYAAIAG